MIPPPGRLFPPLVTGAGQEEPCLQVLPDQCHSASSTGVARLSSFYQLAVPRIMQSESVEYGPRLQWEILQLAAWQLWGELDLLRRRY